MLIFAFILLLFSVPIYWTYDLINSLCTNSFNNNNKNSENIEGKFKKQNHILFKRKLKEFFIIVLFFICTLIFPISSTMVETGVPLQGYSYGGVITAYTPLSFNHMPTAFVIFILGIIAYYTLTSLNEKLAPLPYVLCCSTLIINIIFSFMIFTQIFMSSSVNESLDVTLLSYFSFCFLILSFMYIATLKRMMDKFRKEEESFNKEFSNPWFNKIYILFVKYNNKPILWIISFFPVLLIIQLILVIFGQQPDSFIKVFFDTSNYNYSKVIPPDPIIIPGDSHYLCTVSARGHEKIVKPLRAGIRSNKRILVNRQLLVANAFENILEQYTPKTHKAIRYIYDKYGYPLSKHINNKFSADLTYFIMKPLEWIFLVVLYSVDKNPENRINIQYSELRK